MKAIWKMKDNCEVLDFGNYYVKKESDRFYGVFDEFNNLITSGTTFDNSCKKAKLLQRGFNSAKERF